MNVTIVICYVRGTHEMMSVCVGSIARHTKIPIILEVAAAEGNIDDGLLDVVRCFENENLVIQVSEIAGHSIKKNWEHGSLLDVATKNCVTTDYVLTMDSDCFPVVDGWLERLLAEIDGKPEVATAGILHPWAPPPTSLKPTALEWRVRWQHCWDSTHVACQLVRTKDAKWCIESNSGYTTGDDTGLGMVKFFRLQGRVCRGFRPTRCPKPAVPFDAEFNRYTCVVYGDAVVHIGGFTRETVKGDDSVFRNAFGWVEERVLEEGGAEFLLDDAESYHYTLNREDEVAAEKMQRLFGLESQRMQA